MKRLIQLGWIGALSSMLLLGACERQKSVEAGNDDTSAITAAHQKVAVGPTMAKPIPGTLLKVNAAKHTFVIRVENGMLQTFVYDVLTTVNGLPPSTVPGDTTSVRRLNGKAGSELVVQWRNDNGAKLATSIDVTHLRANRTSNSRTSSGTAIH